MAVRCKLCAVLPLALHRRRPPVSLAHFVLTCAASLLRSLHRLIPAVAVSLTIDTSGYSRAISHPRPLQRTLVRAGSHHVGPDRYMRTARCTVVCRA
jgi:hypothetical protein